MSQVIQTFLSVCLSVSNPEINTPQCAAIQAARPLAQQAGGELRIHGTNNRIRESWIYGNDPHPPKGKTLTRRIFQSALSNGSAFLGSKIHSDHLQAFGARCACTNLFSSNFQPVDHGDCRWQSIHLLCADCWAGNRRSSNGTVGLGIVERA